MSGAAVQNLSVDFHSGHGRVHALRDLSFEVGAGRILGLVGESGSGKSTAAFAMMGLLDAHAEVVSGTASIGGRTLDLTAPEAAAPLRGEAMAMIFQDPLLSLNPVFTVGAHLGEVLRRCHPELGRRAKRAMAADALDKVGLSEPRRRLAQFPHELSGGMRQRVVIAMALLARPKLLIADEPTTALDVTVEAQVMREICALRDAIGCSVLLITHSLGVVMQYCDDLVVLYAGERMEAGSARDVRAAPGHPYTRMLLQCEVALDQPRAASAAENRFRVIGGDLPDPRRRPPGCIFHPRCDAAFAACPQVVPADYPAGRRDGGAAGHVARCLLLAQP